MMSKKDFEEILNKHETVKSDIDWDKKKQEWLNFVQQFYHEVGQWLKPYVDQKKLKYDYHEINLTEEYIGTYTVKAMNISFAGQQVKLEPIGTLLIGTKGRIDMEGARGRVQFILADGNKVNVSISIKGETKKENQERKEPDWTWKIVLKEQRKIAYDDFNEESFFNALMEIING
jgi:hypothetical protein